MPAAYFKNVNGNKRQKEDKKKSCEMFIHNQTETPKL